MSVEDEPRADEKCGGSAPPTNFREEGDAMSRQVKFRAWVEGPAGYEMFLADQIDLTGDQGILVLDENGDEFWFPNAVIM